ncbi:uncharacterized protein A1O5_13142 [Cladophialophora psammophila CBS 110553]|uniref:Uncharacterized protein n=1 Tax=Cladophialophora psammophila CBS 110553 TaxID=1182543 RepID=W9VKM3_9EURO|nr:uncharacterized protein A1O5_13142 [Cladophialophora psammophila CBS 110553]EXJ53575.1 hypothetical protein A1O5_13142 [Cladophialophora psammophila CBS 110553]
MSKNISLNRPASGSESSAVVEIRYPGIEGDRFINGAKGAINSLTMALCDNEAVEAFIQMTEERRVVPVLGDVPSAAGSPKKESIAFIELGSASADDNHEKSKRLDATMTSEADGSSPLRNISLRTRQKVRMTAASTTQTHTSKSASSSSVKPAEDTPTLKRPSEVRPLIERLRASQEGPNGAHLKAKVSSQQSQMRHRDSGADLVKGVLGEGPSFDLSAAVTTRTFQSQPRGLGQTPSSNKSIHKQPAELADRLASNSSKGGVKIIGADPGRRGDKRKVGSARKRPRDQITMAKLAEAQPGLEGNSQVGNAPAKGGLKRKTIKGSTAHTNEQSQKPSQSTPKTAQFDLPPDDDEEPRPTKKAKTKNPKPTSMASVKESIEKKKGNVQIAASPKGQKKRGPENKLGKRSEKKIQKTATSTRARRAGKTPKYVEESNESGEGSAGQETNEEEEIEEHDQKDDKVDEDVEDSHPLSKGGLEDPLKVSQLEFESNMRGTVDGDCTAEKGVPTEGAPSRDASDEQAEPKPNSLVQPVPHEHTPARKDKHVPNPPGAKAVPKDKPSITTHAKQKSTPRPISERLSESSIPPVSEKLFRKTKIVHFGPQGPDNQAVQQNSLAEVAEPETTKEASPIPQQAGLVQGEHVIDIDEVVQDRYFEPILKSPEIKGIQPSPAQDDGDILEDPKGRDLVVKTHVEDRDEQSVERHNGLATDMSYDKETSEDVFPEGEEGASEHYFQLPNASSSLKPDMQQLKPQTPVLDDEVSACEAPEAKGPPVSQKPTRQSIGINAVLDEEYPQAQKVVNTDTLRANHQRPTMREVRRRSVAPDVPSPVSQEVVKSYQLGSTHERDEVEVVSNDNVTYSGFPIPASQNIRGNANDVYDRTIPSRKENSQIVPQHGHGLSISLPRSAAEPMGPPLPRTEPFGSVQRPNPLRKSWPESQVEGQAALPQMLMNEAYRPAITGPVRVKKSLSLSHAGGGPVLEPEMPPATPASFSTRLNLDLPLPANVTPGNEGSKMTEHGDTCQNAGNDSLALVNEDENFFGDRSTKGPRLGRRQRSESGDDSFVVSATFHRTGEAVRQGDPMMGVISARESQRGLLDAIINITNDVLFRFGTEEDAMKAKVDEYHRGGKEIIRTLTDTWNQRLEHGNRLLVDVLKAEKEVLTTALQLVRDRQHSGGAWKEIVYDQGLTGKVQEKRDSLLKVIEKLTNRG